GLLGFRAGFDSPARVFGRECCSGRSRNTLDSEQNSGGSAARYRRIRSGATTDEPTTVVRSEGRFDHLYHAVAERATAVARRDGSDQAIRSKNREPSARLGHLLS